MEPERLRVIKDIYPSIAMYSFDYLSYQSIPTLARHWKRENAGMSQ